MDEELSTIRRNKTWDLVEYPKENNVIELEWLFKIKYNFDGSVQKYKARLFAKGYLQ